MWSTIKPFTALVGVIQSSKVLMLESMQVLEFVKRHVGTYTPLLAGNSVYVDFLFLKVRKTSYNLNYNI